MRGSAHWLWGPAGAMLYAAVVAAVLIFGGGSVPAACAASPRRAVELRFLLVGPESDGSIRAWEAALDREGLRYRRVDPAALATLRLVGAAGTGGFAATVVGAPLSSAGEARLATYESSFGLRRIDARVAVSTGPVSVARLEVPLDGKVARLTAAGAAVFPYLKGPVPIDGATGRPATLGPGATSLLDLGSRSLLAEWRRADGVEVLGLTVRESPGVLHELLLAPGLISWALQGAVPGSWQPFFDVQVDDVLLPSFTWIQATHSSGYASGRLNPTTLNELTARMTPADVGYAAAWARRERFTLDLGLNGYGLGSDCDALTRAVVRDAHDFRWFNHTFQHLDFDFLDARQMTAQIVDNVHWAKEHRILLTADELVTGQHSGLHNPQLTAALHSAGIHVLASDASRDPLPLRFGDAVALPRHPMNVYQDAVTRQEELDEFDFRYVTSCRGTGCLPKPLTWPQFVERESTRLLRLVLANDPRPSYAHQSNLAGDRILLDVLSRTLGRYRALVRAPFLQPTMTAALRDLELRLGWEDALRHGEVTIVRRSGSLVFRSRVAVSAPLTVDGALRWLPLRAGVAKEVAAP